VIMKDGQVYKNLLVEAAGQRNRPLITSPVAA